MDRQEYINHIATILRGMLEAETRLPCKFVASGSWYVTDCPMIIYLDPETPYTETFEGAEVFAELERRLNDQFTKNPWYFGIGLGVPQRFLGQKYLDALQDQTKDNERYRKVRLKDEDHE